MACLPLHCGPPTHTIAQIAHAWTANGGDPSQVIVAVAVSLAESCGGDQYAVSPSCAIGLWQILYSHLDNSGLPLEALYDENVNARFAVQISHNGTDWGAWDVAYKAGEGLTSRYFIGYPEAGSAAYNQIPNVTAALGYAPVDTGGGPVTSGTPGVGVNPIGGIDSGPTGSDVNAPVIHTTFPVISGSIFTIPPAGLPPVSGYGWDNLVQYWTRDPQDVVDKDATYQTMIAYFSGGVPWQG